MSDAEHLRGRLNDRGGLLIDRFATFQPSLLLSCLVEHEFEALASCTKLARDVSITCSDANTDGKTKINLENAMTVSAPQGRSPLLARTGPITYSNDWTVNLDTNVSCLFLAELKT